METWINAYRVKNDDLNDATKVMNQIMENGELASKVEAVIPGKNVSVIIVKETGFAETELWQDLTVE